MDSVAQLSPLYSEEALGEEVLINDNLPDDSSGQAVDSDAKLLRSSDTSSLSAHNEQYTALLKAYVDNFKAVSKSKKTNKEQLFKIAKRLLFWTPIATFGIIICSLYCVVSGKMTAVEVIPELVTALGTVVGTFLLIPKMITSYLFNEKEEDHLKEIIGKIQDYDRQIRGGL